jgi:predicted RNA-binding protein with PIN domain
MTTSDPTPTPTRWVVDAMNVIGSRPDGWWRDRRGAMRMLAERLNDLERATGDEVVVIFDSEPFDLPVAPKAVFAGPGGADDAIVRLVRADPDPATLQVVTSDKELAARVHEAGAQVVGSRGFRELLDGA